MQASARGLQLLGGLRRSLGTLESSCAVGGARARFLPLTTHMPQACGSGCVGAACFSNGARGLAAHVLFALHVLACFALRFSSLHGRMGSSSCPGLLKRHLRFTSSSALAVVASSATQRAEQCAAPQLHWL